MTETAVAEISADSWVHEQEGLDDADKQTLSKYDTPGDAIKASAHATRKFAEYDEQIKNSVNWPDDKTPVEDRAAFDTKMHTYRGVPEKAEGYEFDRSTIPEHIAYDQELEDGLRQLSVDKKISKSVASDIHGFYTKAMLARHEAIEKVA
ncbi:hypothetical protein LCGC14_2413190, partial [marine sediment metagenome]